MEYIQYCGLFRLESGEPLVAVTKDGAVQVSRHCHFTFTLTMCVRRKTTHISGLSSLRSSNMDSLFLLRVYWFVIDGAADNGRDSPEESSSRAVLFTWNAERRMQRMGNCAALIHWGRGRSCRYPATRDPCYQTHYHGVF